MPPGTEIQMESSMSLSYHKFRLRLLGLLSVLLMIGCMDTPQSEPAAESAAIAAADQAYASAWLANDPDAVLATLTEDAIILPSGLESKQGQAQIRQFWFPPDSPITKVTEFSLDQREIDGSGDLGFVRGSFTLGFDYDGTSYRSRGDYVSILRKLDDGDWKISRRAWNDLPMNED